MSDFRALAHLQEQLGEELWQALISSDNTGKVKEFCNSLIQSILPTTMTIGSRIYEILAFLKEGGESVTGDVMVARAKKMDAHLGKDDREYILAHQDEIPSALQGKADFVFTDDHPSGRPEHVYFVGYGDNCWGENHTWLDGRGVEGSWFGSFRLLRRIK